MKIKFSIFCCLVVIVSFLKAEENEFGMGFTAISFPSYIGSDKQVNKVYPFPYVDFKSEYVNIKNDKIYNEFFKKGNLKIELNLSGRVPTDSKDTSREGMPDLDAMFEIGPEISYLVYEKNDLKLFFELPLRGAFVVSGDSFFEYTGLTGSFDLKYTNKLFDKYNFIFKTGLLYNDKKYNSYYYDVSGQYIDVNRQEYYSKSGFAGYYNSVALTRKYDDFWVGTFFKYYNINNASFEESPLVDTKHSFLYGFGISYLF